MFRITKLIQLVFNHSNGGKNSSCELTEKKQLTHLLKRANEQFIVSKPVIVLSRPSINPKIPKISRLYEPLKSLTTSKDPKDP